MSRQHPGELSAKQRQAIDALLTCPNVKTAASSINVPARTLWSWLATPAFKAEYEKRASAGADLLRTQIAALSESAILALIESLNSPSHLAKVQALKIVIDRLYPEVLVSRLDAGQDVASGPIPAELLAYLKDEEIATIEQLLDLAKQRKLAEQATQTR